MLKKLSDVLDFSKANAKNSQYKAKSQGSFNFLALIHKWPEIVGEKLAKVTIPVKNQHNTLTIMTDNPAYSQSLSFLEETLKKKIYKVFPMLDGRINKFYFQVNNNYFAKERETLIARSQMWAKGSSQTVADEKQLRDFMHQYNPEYVRLKKIALAEFASIEMDEEIRESLVNLYIQVKIKK